MFCRYIINDYLEIYIDEKKNLYTYIVIYRRLYVLK